MQIRKSFELDPKSVWKAEQSTLELFLGPFRIKIQITGPTSSRGSKTLLLLIFRKMRELWPYFRKAEIFYSRRGYRWAAIPPRSGQIGSDFETPQHPGFSLRERRNKNRLTLQEVSALSGVNLGHLCDIERGKHNPRRKLLQRIELALARYEQEGTTLSTVGNPFPKNFRKTAPRTPKKPAVRRVDPFYEMLGRMFEAQQRLGASIVDSDPPPKA